MRDNMPKMVASILAGTASVVVLSGCAGDPDEAAACERLLDRTAVSVEDVDAADFTCRRDFGDPGQRGTIALAVETQREATPVIEDIHRAFASEPSIGDAWTVYVDFTSTSGEEFNDEALDFDGDPPMYKLRERYDIHPSGTS